MEEIKISLKGESKNFGLLINEEGVLEVKSGLGSSKLKLSGKDIYSLTDHKIFVGSYINYKNVISLLKKRVLGVTEGYYLELELVGLGYKFIILKNILMLKLGYSHYIKVKIPKTVRIIGYKNRLIVFGLSREVVSKFYLELARFKKKDAYKGKGIRKLGSKIELKEGKQR